MSRFTGPDGRFTRHVLGEHVASLEDVLAHDELGAVRVGRARARS